MSPADRTLLFSSGDRRYNRKPPSSVIIALESLPTRSGQGPRIRREPGPRILGPVRAAGGPWPTRPHPAARRRSPRSAGRRSGPPGAPLPWQPAGERVGAPSPACGKTGARGAAGACVGAAQARAARSPSRGGFGRDGLAQAAGPAPRAPPLGVLGWGSRALGTASRPGQARRRPRRQGAEPPRAPFVCGGR